MNEKTTPGGKDLLYASVVVAILLWMSNSILEFLWFNPEGWGFGSILVPMHDSHVLFMRIFFISVLFISGGVVSGMYTRLAESEQKAREEKNQLSITLNSIGDAVITTDERGRVARMNPIAEALTGRTLDRVKGDPLTDVFTIIHARTREACENPVDRVIREGRSVGLANHRVLAPRHGEEREIADSAAPIRSEDGTITGVVLVFRDVTEEHRIRRHITENEERFRQVAMTNWVWETDTTGRYTYCSDNVIDSLGYSAEEMLGRTAFDFMPEEEAARVRWIFEETVANVKPIVDLENWCLTRDGREVCMLTNGVPFFDEEGAFVGYRGADKDITERKHAEEKLRSLRNYLSNIIDSMPSVLVGVDSDGRVTQWNKTAEQTTGTPTGAARGKALSEVFPRMASEMGKIIESIRAREAKQERKRPRPSENGVRYEDVTIYPLTANGVEGAVIRIDDVTEKVRMEEMMIQSEKMLSVGGLAAGMAHEINNPLAGILQNAQVIKIRVSDGLPKNRRVAEECGSSMEVIHAYMEKRGVFKMLDSIFDSGGRAARIVSNMLSFSRKSGSNFAPRNMATLLDQTIELAENDYDLKKKYDFRRIEIVREYDEAIPDAWCEGSKIQQVFLNILKNGAQAMAEADARPPRFFCRISRAGEMIGIEIEDNGPGMDETTRKRVFEPFFTTKGVKAGTGLGLSVSYFIITENHGGTMAVDSAPGRGAKFIIRLPMKRESAPERGGSL